MLHNHIEQFLVYCQVSNFPPKSIEALRMRLAQFNRYCSSHFIDSIRAIDYDQLLAFVTDFEAPSVHVKKSRVWAIRHFYNFLKLKGIIDYNPASYLRYPQIARKVPQFLTVTEFLLLLCYFAGRVPRPFELRNLIVVMLFGFLGLRLRSLLQLNVDDVDLTGSLIRVREKGNVMRQLPLPEILCKALTVYLCTCERPRGPLLLSKRNKRLSERTVQNFLRAAMSELGIKKHIHAHLFRHTAATHLNKVAGPDVTQHVLGHATRSNTVKYTHLNPDIYAAYMQKHPYMNL